jgi:hypothetical protein
MNYQMIDFLEKVFADDYINFRTILVKEGVLTSDNQVVVNKINLMTGAYASTLIDEIIDADMNQLEILSHIKMLYAQKQYYGVYYFLLYLFNALEIEVPYLFITFL